MQQMTVKGLLDHLKGLVKKHPEVADKFIVVGDDNEGNGFHGMFFGITYDEKTVKDCIEFSNGVSDSCYDDPKELVILG